MLAALFLVAGCGYRVASSSIDAPGGTTVAVPLFANRTFEPFLEARVTERVKSRLVNGGPWRLVNAPDAAAVVVRGVVTVFGVTPVSFDAANRPLEQRVSIAAEVTAESRGGEAFRATLTGTAEYRETTDSLQTRAAKNRAIEEAGDFLAQDLVARLRTHLSAQRRPESGEPRSAPATP